MRSAALLSLIALSASISAAPVPDVLNVKGDVQVGNVADITINNPGDSQPASEPASTSGPAPAALKATVNQAKAATSGDGGKDDTKSDDKSAPITADVKIGDASVLKANVDLKDGKADASLAGHQLKVAATGGKIDLEVDGCPQGYKKDDLGICVLLDLGDALKDGPKATDLDAIFRAVKPGGGCDDFYYFNPVMQLCVAAHLPAQDQSGNTQFNDANVKLSHPAAAYSGTDGSSYAMAGLSCASGFAPQSDAMKYGQQGHSKGDDGDGGDNGPPRRVNNNKAATPQHSDDGHSGENHSDDGDKKGEGKHRGDHGGDDSGNGFKDDSREKNKDKSGKDKDDDNFRPGKGKNAVPSTDGKNCPAGKTFDSILSLCVDAAVGTGKDCGDGQVLNILGLCVKADIDLEVGKGVKGDGNTLDASKATKCGAGQTFDSVLSICADVKLGGGSDDKKKSCSSGQEYNALLGVCADITIGSGSPAAKSDGDKSCPAGQILNLLGLCVNVDISIGGGDNGKDAQPAESSQDPKFKAVKNKAAQSGDKDADHPKCPQGQYYSYLENSCVPVYGSEDDDKHSPKSHEKNLKDDGKDFDDSLNDNGDKFKKGTGKSLKAATPEDDGSKSCGSDQHWDPLLHICVDAQVGNIAKVDADISLL